MRVMVGLIDIVAGGLPGLGAVYSGSREFLWLCLHQEDYSGRGGHEIGVFITLLLGVGCLAMTGVGVLLLIRNRWESTVRWIIFGLALIALCPTLLTWGGIFGWPMVTCGVVAFL